MHPIISPVTSVRHARMVQTTATVILPLRLAQLALSMALVVVLMGGWTRLNDAGLSCPDWPGCYGELILPSSAEGQAKAQLRYPEVPIDSARAWLEMGHRYLAATLGALVLLLALIAYRQPRPSRSQSKRDYPRRLSYLLLALVIIQGVFGMWTVTLKLLPQVVTIHLLGGLLTVALLVLLTQRLRLLAHSPVSIQASLTPHSGSSPPPQSDREKHSAARWILIAIVLLMIQVGLGGWTSSNYAGWACPHWFSCQTVEQEDANPMSLDFQAAFSLPAADQQSFLGGRKSPQARAAIQMAHRGMGLLLLLYLCVLAARLWPRHNLRAASIGIAGLALGQALLGVLNIVLGLPLGLAFAHHLGALLLLLLLMWLYRLSRLDDPGGTYGWT